MVLVIFRRFLNFGSFFCPFVGTVVENAKHNRVAPGNSLNCPKKIKKNHSINICVPKMRFSKMYIFGPKLNQLGLVWYLHISSKARASRGLDKKTKLCTQVLRLKRKVEESFFNNFYIL